jgi:ABC-type Fe3+/spermidine/putrescine transport system ATPase subunit
MLDLIEVAKSFGHVRAVRGVSLAVAEGEVVALLGPSGCGKSTLLSLIAGLERPDRGDIRWAEQSVLAVPVHARRFGLMFQDYALFPHLTVVDNIAFGLRLQALPAAEIEARVHELLAQVNLPGYGRRDVTTLSGGERQRVALARALAPRPRLLMLDEPLGALDRALREDLLFDLRQLLRQLGQTAIVVTHDQGEAMTLARRVAVMNAGRIEQVDTPDALVARPANGFVAQFLGLGDLLPARLTAQGRVTTPLASFDGVSAEPVGTDGHLLVRHDAAILQDDGAWVGEVVDVIRSGLQTLTVLDLGGQRLRFELPSTPTLVPGQRVRFHLKPDGLRFLPAPSASRGDA